MFPDRIYQKYGITDHYSTDMTVALIEQNKVPDFLMVYFPDLDKKSHKHGPLYTKGLKEVDKHFQAILNA